MTPEEQGTRLLKATDLHQQVLIVIPDLTRLVMWNFSVMLNIEKKCKKIKSWSATNSDWVKIIEFPWVLTD